MAENATHNLHNLLTLRGALVRDPHIWAHYLTEAIELFAGQSDVVFASHHWPTWGTANIIEFLSVQRDLYAYLHDQTLRLLNQGYTGAEIAEMFDCPGPGAGLAHARLLRLGQPQRQGHLPALPGLLADVFERFGYGAENGTWRCEFLSAAHRTADRHGVMTCVKDSDKPVSLTLTVPAAALFALAGGTMDAARSNGLITSGDESQLASLFSVLQPGNPGSNIVEP